MYIYIQLLHNMSIALEPEIKAHTLRVLITIECEDRIDIEHVIQINEETLKNHCIIIPVPALCHSKVHQVNQ